MFDVQLTGINLCTEEEKSQKDVNIKRQRYKRASQKFVIFSSNKKQ